MTESERKLRAAMARLIAGKAQRTNGALSKNNLHYEAGVSRATMNRYPSVLAEWDQAVAAGSKPAKDLEQEILTKNAEIKKLRQNIRDLGVQLTAASTVIVALHGERLQWLEAEARKAKPDAQGTDSTACPSW
jgi:wobble nucleotide-excising tRNase